VTVFKPPAQVYVGAPDPFSVTVLPEQIALLLLEAVKVGIPILTLIVTVLRLDVHVESIEPRTEYVVVVEGFTT
jgi:hypothetical protein